MIPIFVVVAACYIATLIIIHIEVIHFGDPTIWLHFIEMVKAFAEWWRNRG
jgi:hypothetical protein